MDGTVSPPCVHLWVSQTVCISLFLSCKFKPVVQFRLFDLRWIYTETVFVACALTAVIGDGRKFYSRADEPYFPTYYGRKTHLQFLRQFTFSS